MGHKDDLERISCGSWESLVEQFDGLAGWAFRGHASAKWELQTTLERHAPSDQARFLSEAELLREFRRRAHNYLGAHEMPTTTSEWLAVMQHYGAPTRLLDVTRSPYVAAYFAFEDLPSDGASESVVWAIDPRWCARRSGAEGLKHLPYLTPEVDRMFTATNGIIDRELIAGMKLADLREDASLSRLFPSVLPLDPQKISDRMSVQQGMFVWPGNVELSFMDNLRAIGPPADGVKQLVIAGRVRSRALEQLRLMNITRASLFRGLDGFAQSFRQLLVREPPVERRQRAAIRALLDEAPGKAGPSRPPGQDADKEQGS